MHKHIGQSDLLGVHYSLQCDAMCIWQWLAKILKLKLEMPNVCADFLELNLSAFNCAPKWKTMRK